MSDEDSEWISLQTTTAPVLQSTPTSATSSVGSLESNVSEPADGEYNLLLQSLDDDESTPLTHRVERELEKTLSNPDITTHSIDEAFYGNPLSCEEAAERMPYQDGGLVWHCTIIPDVYFVDGQLKRGLNRRDFDLENQTLRARRSSLPVTQTDFFSSLTQIAGPHGPRYIFSGVLNGWPSMRCFELLSLEERRHTTATALLSPKELIFGQLLWRKIWDVSSSSIPPQQAMPTSFTVCRAKLRGPPWTSVGWTKESLGHVFWYEPQHGPRFTHGTNLLATIGHEKCSDIHMVSHRYAVGRESPKDRITYHSFCLLEWEHGEYCSVIELAYLNGLGGYKGKSNWYDDKDEPETLLYQTMPPEMICPWRTNAAEIRCMDVAAKNLDDMKEFMNKYKGNNQRFIDPQFSFSHPARLTFRSKNQIAQYLINYVMRDSSYGDLKRNCQTFSADLCAFIAGKRDIAPYHPVSRIDFQNRTYFFIYDSHMYESREAKKKKKHNKLEANEN